MKSKPNCEKISNLSNFINVRDMQTFSCVAESQAELERRKMLIRNKWQLAYTLVRNPILLVDRLSHLRMNAAGDRITGLADGSSTKAKEEGSIAISISEVSVIVKFKFLLLFISTAYKSHVNLRFTPVMIVPTIIFLKTKRWSNVYHRVFDSG